MASATKARAGSTAPRKTTAASKPAAQGGEQPNQNPEQQRLQQGQPQRDAAELLKADHRDVEQLFERFDQATDDEQKAEIVRQLCTNLIVHSRLEEEIFYPACRQQLDEAESLDEAQVEHDGAKVLIADLMSQRPGGPFFEAKVKVLAEYIRHHVAEEEKPGEGILAQAESSGVDMQALGRQIEARKQDLMGRAAELPMPQPRSFDIRRQGSRNFRQEDQDMERRFDRDRDERGRFISDDDVRGNGRTSSRAYGGGGGRYGNEDDDRNEGRGWHGDPQGHAEASRRGWEERGGSRSRGRDDDDDDRRYSRGGSDGRGWFGDPQRHAEASRRGSDERGGGRGRDEDDRRYSSRGGNESRGWHGDPQGHSEASGRGWEERGGGRDRDDDDDRRYASRGRDDDDRRYSSRGGSEGRGWFGDPQGHAAASRRGWEDRGGGRGRDDDDDRRSASRGGSQGGWFGDSRGHSEAARRGWRNRDE